MLTPFLGCTFEFSNRWLLLSDVSPDEYRSITENRDEYGALLRYMRYKAPTQEVWIVDSNVPVYDAVRRTVMEQVVAQQKSRSTAVEDALVAREANGTFWENL